MSTDLDNKAMDATGQLPIPEAPGLGCAAPLVWPSQHQGLVPAGNPELRGRTSQLLLCTCVNAEHLFCPQLIFLISLLKCSVNSHCCKGISHAFTSISKSHR